MAALEGIFNAAAKVPGLGDRRGRAAHLSSPPPKRKKGHRSRAASPAPVMGKLRVPTDQSFREQQQGFAARFLGGLLKRSSSSVVDMTNPVIPEGVSSRSSSRGRSLLPGAIQTTPRPGSASSGPNSPGMRRRTPRKRASMLAPITPSSGRR